MSKKKIFVVGKSKRLAAISLVAGAAIFTAGAHVIAGLNATATGADSANVGTLKLSQTASSGSVGLAQTITNLAPGDVVNRYVTLLNGGTLDAKDLGLAIAATGTASLITDGSGAKALTVAVNSCSGSWNATTGACTGTSTVEVAATPLNTWSTKQIFNVTKTLAANTGATNLQIQVALPDQNETTINGVLPGVTVQNGSVTLNYTFSEAQRISSASNN